MSYDVNIPQCITVSNAASTEAKGYETASKSMSTALTSAAKDSQSQLVANALSGYNEKAYNKDVSALTTLFNNATKALNEALTHINNGDEEMSHTSLASLGKTEGQGADAPGKAGPKATGGGSRNKPLPMSADY